MRKINMKAAALVAAVPVIAITLFVISRMENNDAPGLYISESTSSAAEASSKTDSRRSGEGSIDDEAAENSEFDVFGDDGEDIADSETAAEFSGDSGGQNDQSGAANNGAGGSGQNGSKNSSSGTGSGEVGSSSTGADSASSSAAGKDTGSNASGGSGTGSDKDPSKGDDVPEVKYTFDTLDKMVDGNFSISTSGQVNYMVNAKVSGAAEYDGDNTHIKVDSAEFPAVASNVFMKDGETYRVISQDNATYSHNKSLVSAFIDFGSLFESFAANRDYLVPIECSASGDVTTEKFSYTYYDDLYFYDYVTLLITITYDGSGTPNSLLITTNEDYGYEQLYKSDSLSFSPSIGGVDIPDFDSWTCVDTPS